MWSMAIAGLALGSLGMVGGTTLGDQLGPMIIGYSLLIALSALYLVAGLAVRDRVWHRVSRTVDASRHADRLAGRRVF